MIRRLLSRLSAALPVIHLDSPFDLQPAPLPSSGDLRSQGADQGVEFRHLAGGGDGVVGRVGLRHGLSVQKARPNVLREVSGEASSEGRRR